MDFDTLQTLSLIILLAPLAGAVLAGALGRPLLRGATHWVVILGVAGAAGAAFLLLLQVHGVHDEPPRAQLLLYEWIATGAAQGAAAGAVTDTATSPATWFNVELLIDPLSATMLVTVTFISLLVVIYSRDYMRNHGKPERGYERFFAFLGLFVFAMCTLVLGGNFLLLYLGWEAVGLCSYLLIGFYYGRPAAAAAAKKAFLVNRIGDFGFGLGVILIYFTFGTLEYGPVFDLVRAGVTGAGDALDPSRVTLIALLLFCGACGKSAQLPLHVWLPDAMEGPSPVSALIHAATMVTAGVYMVARCGALFTASPVAMTVVAVVGAATALFAATIALVQTDLKRILAYSTISQLGYMFLGLGAFAADSAIFHLFTHAFFKALLFLAAGSVMHAMGGIIDVRRFGGLWKVLPWTFITFIAGAAALAGIPFFSGFFSKDEIIHHAFEAHWLLGTVGMVTAVLTAFYTGRMVCLAFFGPKRIPEGVHPHESGGWMLLALSVLALGAVGAGYFGVHAYHQPFHHFLAPVFAHTFAAHQHAQVVVEQTGFWAEYGLLVVSGALAIGGVLVAVVCYVAMPWIPATVKAVAIGLHQTLWHKYYVDELYDEAVVKPLRRGGQGCVGCDDYGIDGLIWLVTAVPRGLAYAFRTLQAGALQGYALCMVVGAVVILLLVMNL